MTTTDIENYENAIFAAVAADARTGGARDPEAVAAVVGRRKHGQKEMTRRAVAGRKAGGWGRRWKKRGG